MEKSTHVHSTGKVWLKACDKYEECDGECWYCRSHLMERALERLAAYEETGLTPNEIEAAFSRTEITPEGIACMVSRAKE